MKKIYLIAVLCVVLICGSVFFRLRQGTSDYHVSSEMQTCSVELSAQENYLAKEQFANIYTFNQFAATSSFIRNPAALDTASSKSAAEFRTKISERLSEFGINFAGHYSIVGVGMTGWGNNYWIIDRENGKAYEFPYHALDLEFASNSNLIVMNSKEFIWSLLAEQNQNCYYLNQEKISSLRPFYFLWQNNELKTLGPLDLNPPRNKFWDEYFVK